MAAYPTDYDSGYSSVYTYSPTPNLRAAAPISNRYNYDYSNDNLGYKRPQRAPLTTYGIAGYNPKLTYTQPQQPAYAPAPVLVNAPAQTVPAPAATPTAPTFQMDYGGFKNLSNYAPQPVMQAPAAGYIEQRLVDPVPVTLRMDNNLKAVQAPTGQVPATTPQYTPYNWNDGYAYDSLEGYTPDFTGYGSGGDPRPGLAVMQGGGLPAGVTPSAAPDAGNPFVNWLSGVGKNFSTEIGKTPWMGKGGILDTGANALNAFSNWQMMGDAKKTMAAQRGAMEQQGKLLTAQAGELANRQGRLRAVNAGKSATEAYAAGDKYQADKMAQWGL